MLKNYIDARFPFFSKNKNFIESGINIKNLALLLTYLNTLDGPVNGKSSHNYVMSRSTLTLKYAAFGEERNLLNVIGKI